jgi:hypothetical protein
MLLMKFQFNTQRFKEQSQPCAKFSLNNLSSIQSLKMNKTSLPQSQKEIKI